MVHDKKNSQDVRQIFRRIAPHYNLVNCLMTGGQDKHWRQEVITLACLSSGDWLLDLGTGTGDLAFEAQQHQLLAHIVAADFTIEMMQVGQHRGCLQWLAADALHLPFKDEIFDAVVSGFLMRNVEDVQVALQEQYRVLRRGGRIVILDTTRPYSNIFAPLLWIYLHFVVPFLGGVMTGEVGAYRYLTYSTECFLTAEQLAEQMAMIGFHQVAYRRRMFGAIAIHWGEK